MLSDSFLYLFNKNMLSRKVLFCFLLSFLFAFGNHAEAKSYKVLANCSVDHQNASCGYSENPINWPSPGVPACPAGFEEYHYADRNSSGAISVPADYEAAISDVWVNSTNLSQEGPTLSVGESSSFSLNNIAGTQIGYASLTNTNVHTPIHCTYYSCGYRICAAVIPEKLSLSASTSSSNIILGKTATITFKVLDSKGVAVAGSAVGAISASSGSLSASSCTTNASGVCSVIYTPSEEGHFSVTAQGASPVNTYQSPSSSASSSINVGEAVIYTGELIWNGRPVKDRAEDLIDFLLRIAGGLALLMLIVSGITYAFSSGSPEIGTKAKKIFISALMGLIVIILSYSFLAFMDQILTN